CRSARLDSGAGTFVTTRGLLGRIPRVDERHDALTHLSVAPRVLEFALDAVVVHHDDAVGDDNHLRHVARDQKDCGSLMCEAAQKLMNIALGLDVDAYGRLVDIK